jgi:peptidoglycan/LPS O-acetylase OafA/YrhL
MSLPAPSEQTQPIHPKYRADIDGLRAIAVLSVVGFHAFPFWIKGGFIGVDIFFVISGFLISTIIFDSLERKCFSFIDFYTRRINRIFPALLLILAGSLVLGWFVLLPDAYKQLGKHITGGAGFISNFVLWNENGYFDNAAASKPLLHLWSLGIEEQFYIAWPLLLAFVWKRKWSFVAVTAIIAAVSFAFNIYLINIDAAAAFYLPSSRFWELMIGGMLAYIGLHKPSLNKQHKNAQSIIGCILIALGLILLNKERMFPGWWALLPTFGAFFLISAGQKAWINRHVLSNKLLVWVGLISYPLYLWHWPLLAFVQIIEGETPSVGMRVAVLAISLVFSWLTYKIIEKPIRLGKNSIVKTISLIGLMLAVGYAGYGCYKGKGWTFSLPKQTIKILQPVELEWSQFGQFVRWNKCYLQEPSITKHHLFCLEQERPLLALWGDSHAASLYPGIKKLKDQHNFGLTQLTQSACGPIFDLTDLVFRKNCNEINQDVLDILSKAKPDVLILNSAWKHWDFPLSNEEINSKFTSTINLIKRKLPSTKIIVIGPLPRWQDSPQKVIFASWKRAYDKSKTPKIMQKAERLDDIDMMLSNISKRAGVAYISALDILCNTEGCISRVGEEPSDLIAVDYGHLSKTGSEYFVEKIKNEIFPLLISSTQYDHSLVQ